MNAAALLKLSQLPTQGRDAIANETTVNLELTFALTKAATDTAASLFTNEVTPHSPQPRKDILKLSKLHLKTTLSSPCVLTENIQNKGGSVDDLHRIADRSLEIRLLRRSKLVIEYDHVGVEVPHIRNEFLYFALPDKGFGDGSIKALSHSEHDLGPIRMRQAGKLRKGILTAPSPDAPINADKNGFLWHGSGRERLESTHQQAPFSPPSLRFPSMTSRAS